MFDTKYCKITHLQENATILCEWKQFCRGDDYRNPLIYANGLINKYDLTTWITDTTNGFESDDADTKWLIEEFMPMMIGSSIKKIIFIIQKDSLLMDEIMGQVEPLSEFFEVKLVESLQDC
jgi:hypothetical protein